MNGSQSPAPSGARRFIFEYDGDRVRVVHQAPVDAVVPTVAAGAATPGLFVDVRDAGEHTLARVAVPDAMSASRELFPEQHDQPIVRADAPKATGAFTVIVPMFSAADHVTLVRIATSSETQPPAPSMIDLISFTITNSGPL